jgi:hypothetical protein
VADYLEGVQATQTPCADESAKTDLSQPGKLGVSAFPCLDLWAGKVPSRSVGRSEGALRCDSLGDSLGYALGKTLEYECHNQTHPVNDSHRRLRARHFHHLHHHSA